MSHSVFKEYPTAAATSSTFGGRALDVDDDQHFISTPGAENVVIVLNKDGTVSVDQNALHTFLRDDAGKTAVSVVRVQSPTPSLEEELRERGEPSSEDESRHSSNGERTDDSNADDSDEDAVENSDDDDNAAGNSDEEDDAELDSAGESGGDTNTRRGRNKKRTVKGGGKANKRNRRLKEHVPDVRLTVEQYLAPDEAKLFAAEILQYAGMSSALTLDVDYDYQRFVVQNDHCYTPLTSPSQKDRGGGGGGSLPSDSAADKGKNRRGAVQVESAAATAGKSHTTTLSSGRRSKFDVKKLLAPDSDEDEEDRDSGDGQAEEEDQSDDDYSVSESENDRDSDLDFRVNSNYLPKKKKKQAAPIVHNKSQNKSVTSAGGGGVGTSSISATGGRQSGGRPGEQAGASSGSAFRKQRNSLISSSSNTASGPSVLARSGGGVEKEQRGPLHQTKLPFKVSPGPVKAAAHLSSNQQSQLSAQRPRPRVTQVPVVIATANKRELLTKEKPPKQDPLFADLSSLFATPDIIKKVGGATSKNAAKEENASRSNIQLPAAFELDLISSIVGEDDNMETRRSTANAAAIAAAASDKNHADDNLDLTDTSLLDSIVGDDGLPEELLQHVAALVENKSLQEVIDKQVLGVEDPLTHLTNLLPKPTMAVPQTPPVVQQPQPRKDSPFVKLAQQKLAAKQSAAAAASLTAPRKEPIKIVRSDGRVITLPPIEAPTTRGAKRRAQTSMDATASPVAISKPVVGSSSKEIAVMEVVHQKQPEQRASTGDLQMVEILSASLLPEVAAPVNVRKKSGSDRGSTSRRASTTPSVAESDMDMDFNSEDDPDRLWCICKQPHNNRFMICCDTCEDWFHGKCVNITKAMGQQMEAAGKEWTCPNCVLGLTGTDQVCMVCHQPAKQDSVYCSDECIVRHANRTQLQQQQQQGGQQSTSPYVVSVAKPLQSSSAAPRIVSNNSQDPPESGKVRVGLLKNAQGRVIVYHKKTKQCLSGDNAPFISNIKEWLAANPAYAIVAPKSEMAEAFKAKQAQLQQLKVKAMQKMVADNQAGGQSQQQQQQQSQQQQQQSQQTQEKIQAKLKFGANKQVLIVHPKTAQQIKVAPTGKSSPVVEKTSPAVLKAPRKTAPEAGTSSGTPTTPMGQRNVQRGEVEPIRLTVRKTLKEHLTQRMAEVKEGSSKLEAAEIEQFALDTEQEMFALFSRDTGHKYKAKYRSLTFNIKDRKNETLFQKICERAVKPYRLVRMSPEELASQELAKWRENENKHQLDMIKKSEMDLLACAKSYVLKSHKGEEVMENMNADNQIEAVDDLTMLSSELGVKEEERSNSKSLESRSKDKKRERSRERDRDKHRSHHSSSKHKRKRSRERSRDRERDRDRTKEKEREKGTSGSGGGGGNSSSSKHKSSHHSSSSSSHHHHVSGSGSKEKTSISSSSGSKKDSSSRHRDKVHTIKEESNHSSSPASNTSSSNNKSSASGGEAQIFRPSKKETEESYDLIEKILQGTSPELVAKLHELEKQKSMVEVKQEKGGEGEPTANEGGTTSEDVEYNPESANPVREDTPPAPLPPTPLHPRAIWNGKVVYQEFHFNGCIVPVYGDTSDVLPDFPAVFDVPGRIGPEVVWDYLGKIKRSVNRDITVVRFLPRSPKDQEDYDSMYSYFESKGRLGVLKPKSDVIKDFYLVPQRKGKLLPSVLLTLKGLGDFETKANCIVGIVVKATLKRPSSSMGGGSGASASKMVKKSQVSGIREEAHQTPPGSPKVPPHKLTMGLPKVPMLATKTDDDEPYSPGGSEEEDSAQDSIPAAPPAPTIVSSELQKEVDRLNRQIEAEKNEIVDMLAKDPLSEEPYSPSRPMEDKVSAIPLANISIPSNLQEILASLKNVGGGIAAQSNKMEVDEEEDDDDDEEYNPMPINSSNKVSTQTYKPRPASPSTRAFLLAQQQQQSGDEIPFLSNSSSSNTDSGPSKLSHMTDAELMSLVPDGVDLGPPKLSEPMPPGLDGADDEEYDPSQ